jgi:hypothetical protein
VVCGSPSKRPDSQPSTLNHSSRVAFPQAGAQVRIAGQLLGPIGKPVSSTLFVFMSYVGHGEYSLTQFVLAQDAQPVVKKQINF